jgi:hypothetical protein
LTCPIRELGSKNEISNELHIWKKDDNLNKKEVAPLFKKLNENISAIKKTLQKKVKSRLGTVLVAIILEVCLLNVAHSQPPVKIQIRLLSESSSWHKRWEPFSLQKRAEEILSRFGIGISQNEQNGWYATLKIKVTEEKGNPFYTGVRLLDPVPRRRPDGYSTNIRCLIVLIDRKGRVLYRAEVQHGQPIMGVEGVGEEEIYNMTVEELQAKRDFIFMWVNVGKALGLDQTQLLTWALQEAIEKSSPEAMREATTNLVRLNRRKEATQILIQALNNKRWDVWITAARLLGDFGNRDALQPLKEMLVKETDKWAREVLSNAIRKIEKRG